jgi:hypothetical protein
VALRLLLEVLLESEPSSDQIALLAVESQDSWLLDIENIPETIGMALDHLQQDRFDELVMADNFLLISSEELLKLFTVCRILGRQNIQLDIQMGKIDKAELRLTIPVARPGK